MASTADGSSVYFSSTLRLKGQEQPLNGKIYIATQDSVSLFRAQERAGVPSDVRACSTGGFADYLAAETSSTGAVALRYRAKFGGVCSYPPNTDMTQIVGGSDDTTVPGIARLSPDGRYALVFFAATARPGSSVSLSRLDLKSGVETSIQLPAPAYPQYIQQLYGGGRVIANDGTAIVAVTDDFTKNSGYILKEGTDPVPFPIADGLPLLIDASGSRVLYQKEGLHLLDLRTLESTLLIPPGASVSGLEMSDDAHRLLFLSDGQMHVLDTGTLLDRTLTNESAKILEAAISADGKTVFAATGIGRLLKISVDEGTQIELIGRTPYLNLYSGPITPGFTTTLMGGGISDSVINATLPLNTRLGNVTVSIGERKLPLTQVTPNSVSFIVPWDIQTEDGVLHIVADVPGDHTPFYFPEVEAAVYPGNAPRAGAILRQDWSQTYVGPIHTGEIIHVYAVGFGAVFPDVPEGTAAPSAEPFSRITQPFTCSSADILYAGLAPGAVERVYQIDIRIGPIPGYQKFNCSLGDLSFTFLTLNIVP